MIFTKRPTTANDHYEFSLVPLVDPVTMNVSQPKHVTVSEDGSVKLVSLSNQVISFIYEMPRYFSLMVNGRFVFFYVINYTQGREDSSKTIFVKGIRISKKLQSETSLISSYIEESLLTYYEDYVIDGIILDANDKIDYFTRMNEGKLYYD